MSYFNLFNVKYVVYMYNTNTMNSATCTENGTYVEIFSQKRQINKQKYGSHTTILPPTNQNLLSGGSGHEKLYFVKIQFFIYQSCILKSTRLTCETLAHNANH